MTTDPLALLLSLFAALLSCCTWWSTSRAADAAEKAADEAVAARRDSRITDVIREAHTIKSPSLEYDNAAVALLSATSRHPDAKADVDRVAAPLSMNTHDAGLNHRQLDSAVCRGRLMRAAIPEGPCSGVRPPIRALTVDLLDHTDQRGTGSTGGMRGQLRR